MNQDIFNQIIKNFPIINICADWDGDTASGNADETVCLYGYYFYIEFTYFIQTSQAKETRLDPPLYNDEPISISDLEIEIWDSQDDIIILEPKQIKKLAEIVKDKISYAG